MYAERPEFVDTLVDFVRSRPAQPVDAFLAQTDARGVWKLCQPARA